ncbi:hypothetical protein, partial [Bradyrhizobium sp.]|uniref:hypothetical protein n=1 Tax=Bradyrhizobium sp. TaxID=376 RepID=UPI0029026A8B
SMKWPTDLQPCPATIVSLTHQSIGRCRTVIRSRTNPQSVLRPSRMIGTTTKETDFIAWVAVRGDNHLVRRCIRKSISLTAGPLARIICA